MIKALMFFLTESQKLVEMIIHPCKCKDKLWKDLDSAHREHIEIQISSEIYTDPLCKHYILTPTHTFSLNSF